jgi:hypothetical protein
VIYVDGLAHPLNHLDVLHGCRLASRAVEHGVGTRLDIQTGLTTRVRGRTAARATVSSSHHHFGAGRLDVTDAATPGTRRLGVLLVGEEPAVDSGIEPR